jgi:hypothetical protein
MNSENVGKDKKKHRKIHSFGVMDSDGCPPTSDNLQYLILIRIGGDLVIHNKVPITFNTPVKLHSPEIILSKKTKQKIVIFPLWKV